MKSVGRSPSCGRRPAPLRDRTLQYLRKRGCVGEETVTDHEGVRGDEHEEDREKERDGLLDTSEVQEDQDDENEDLDRELPARPMPAGRKLKTASHPVATETVIVRT